MKTKIFVMTHKKFDPPGDRVYVPLQVGRALGEDLGYLGDDTGDHISEQNPYYGELTGVYWLWKNCPDVDIAGVCHYRRYFLNEQGELMTQEEYETALENADVLVPRAMQAEGAYRDYFAKAHHLSDLLLTGEVIQEIYPDDYPVFCDVMNQSRYYYGNLCVMRKNLFDQYCGWLFSICAELEKRVDVSGYDCYHQRLFGFLSEELLMVFLTARGLRVKEERVGVTAEKTETTEFKLAMSQLIRMGEFTEAREMFYQYLKIRPDIQLELSDVRREIPDIELILYILEQEKTMGVRGFYEVSHQLRELIDHIRALRAIVRKEKDGQVLTASEQSYLQEKYVTDLAKEVIRINL